MAAPSTPPRDRDENGNENGRGRTPQGHELPIGDVPDVVPAVEAVVGYADDLLDGPRTLKWSMYEDGDMLIRAFHSSEVLEPTYTRTAVRFHRRKDTIELVVREHDRITGETDVVDRRVLERDVL